MSHPLVFALFDDRAAVAQGARDIRSLGIAREHLSVVARDHEEEAAVARDLGGTPGAEIEDSRRAGVLGEVGAEVIAAIGVVLPGVGSVVAAGPLAAAFGELAGHAGGGVAHVLARAGVDESRAARWEAEVRRGALLLGAHVRQGSAGEIAARLRASGARDVQMASWSD